VKPANVKELMAEENIDGALVGGASLTADQFVLLSNTADNVIIRHWSVIWRLYCIYCSCLFPSSSSSW